MNELKLRLMYQEAMKRLRDADTLADAMLFDENSDSPYLLKLLGLELMLKLVYEHEVGRVGSGHAYDLLFQELPLEVQENLLRLAGERIGPSGLTTNHLAILKEWGNNFVDLRYPWEKYAGLTEEQYSMRGERWIARGAKLEAAAYRYYPEELVGLLAALRTVATVFAESSFGAGHL